MTFADLFALFFPLFSPLIFPSYRPLQPLYTRHFNLTHKRTAQQHISPLLLVLALPSASPAAPKLLSSIW
jgi:hypothetical protein